MNFEEIIKRYKRLQNDIGVLKTRSSSLDKSMAKFPEALLEKSEEELLVLAEGKLLELEQNSESAKEIFEKIESLRVSYGF